MCTEPLDSSRLYGLIGESARLLPDAARASLEVMLGLQEKQQLQRLPNDISNVCPAAHRPAGTGMTEALGWQERDALSAILEILHASHQDKGDGTGGELDDRLVEGLIVAGRLIAAP